MDREKGLAEESTCGSEAGNWHFKPNLYTIGAKRVRYFLSLDPVSLFLLHRDGEEEERQRGIDREEEGYRKGRRKRG